MKWLNILFNAYDKAIIKHDFKMWLLWVGIGAILLWVALVADKLFSKLRCQAIENAATAIRADVLETLLPYGKVYPKLTIEVLSEDGSVKEKYILTNAYRVKGDEEDKND